MSSTHATTKVCRFIKLCGNKTRYKERERSKSNIHDEFESDEYDVRNSIVRTNVTKCWPNIREAEKAEFVYDFLISPDHRHQALEVCVVRTVILEFRLENYPKMRHWTHQYTDILSIHLSQYRTLVVCIAVCNKIASAIMLCQELLVFK